MSPRAMTMMTPPKRKRLRLLAALTALVVVIGGAVMGASCAFWLTRMQPELRVLVVEQDISQALRVADHVHCMMEGRITLSGRPADLSREAIHDAYFGVSHA